MLFKQNDKLQHLIISAAIVIVVSHVAGVWWGIAVSAAWGIWKEYCDERKKRQTGQGAGWDWWDILADFLGMLLGVLVR